MKMKRLVVAMAATAVLAVSAVSMTACGGGTVSLEGTTWTVESMTAEGMDMTGMINSMGGMTCEFKDGVLSMTMMGQTETVPYTYENGELVIEGDKATISGDTIKFSEGGSELVLKKK